MVPSHPLSPLVPRTIRSISEGWTDDGSWRVIRFLTERFVTLGADDSSSLDASLAWHHLLMAIGNFKRQAGRIQSSGFVTSEMKGTLSPDEILVPGIESAIRRDDAWSWEVLTQVRGLGVATASTLLAAIWPEDHAICDRRALSAAVGLRGASGDWSGPLEWKGISPESAIALREPTWHQYQWYRSALMQSLSVLRIEDPTLQPVHLERCLYLLDRASPRKGQPWNVYAFALIQHIP